MVQVLRNALARALDSLVRVTTPAFPLLILVVVLMLVLVLRETLEEVAALEEVVVVEAIGALVVKELVEPPVPVGVHRSWAQQTQVVSSWEVEVAPDIVRFQPPVG